MTRQRTRLTLAFVIAGAAVAVHLHATAGQSPAEDAVTLRVEGRANATPWIAASGSTVAVAWGATAEGRADVVAAVSRDGGRSFGAPVRVNAAADAARLGGELPPRVRLRPRRGEAPEIVVVWTARGDATEIRLARSIDGGRTFALPATLQAAGAAGDRGWPALALDDTGTAHAIWLDHRGMSRPRGEAGSAAVTGSAVTGSGHENPVSTQLTRKPVAVSSYQLVSRDLTPAPIQHDHRDDRTDDGVAMAQRSGVYHAAVGARATREREITAGVCYCCKTALAAGRDGWLFAAWRHVYPGNIRDIAFSVSRDGGRSFSAPARVSEDRWQLNGCPDDGPAVAVDEAGAVHVVWPTVVADPEPHGALFYGTTRDGRTFTPRVRIPTMGSARPAHPQIAIAAGGDVVAAWDEAVDGTRRALARRASRHGAALHWGDAIRLDNAPSAYPVLAATPDGMVAAWTSGAPGATVIRVRRLTR